MNLNPTNEGRIVDALLLVKIGVLFLSESARLGKAVKKGPKSGQSYKKVNSTSMTGTSDFIWGLAFPRRSTESYCCLKHRFCLFRDLLRFSSEGVIGRCSWSLTVLRCDHGTFEYALQASKLQFDCFAHLESESRDKSWT